MKNKKGQFYIIAAIIIISVLIGIFVVGNYAKTKKDRGKIYDLGEELDVETGYVYDYGVYNGTNISNLVERWANIYYNYTQNLAEDWVFIYGNEKNATVLYFTKNETGRVCILGFNTCVIPEDTINRKGYVSGKEIEIIFNELPYKFELKEGENFFFVIRGGEYVAT